MTKIRLMLIKAARNSRLGQLRNKTQPRLSLEGRRRSLSELPDYGDEYLRRTEDEVRRRLYGSKPKRK